LPQALTVCRKLCQPIFGRPALIATCGAQEFCPQGLSLRNNAPKAHNPSFLEIIVG
jgi:hypothetical protein